MTDQANLQANLQEKFRERAQQADLRLGPHARASEAFSRMAQAHTGAQDFFRRIRQECRPTLQAYNEAALMSKLRTRAAWKVSPGRFSGPVSEYGSNEGVPWMTLVDTATGKDLLGRAFTREPDDAGYRLAGTGLILTEEKLGPHALGEIAKFPQIVREQLERQIEWRERE